jgi:hypothetical protein
VPYVIGRSNEWAVIINNSGAIQVLWVDSGGTSHYFNSGTHYLVPGTPTPVQVSWNATSVFVLVNGVLDATYAMTTHVTPVATTELILFNLADGVAGATFDEVRISSVVRNSTTYTPAGSAFTSDANTGCLYHLDGGTTLPSPSQAGAGAEYSIKSTGAPFVVKPYASETIDGQSAFYGYAYGCLDLITDGTNWFSTGYSFPPGTVESYLTSSITLTTANALYNVASVTLPPGAWTVTGRFIASQGTASTVFSAWLGPTSTNWLAGYAGASVYEPVGGEQIEVVITKAVTLYASTIVYLGASCSGATATVYAGSSAFSTPNASGITAVRTE